VISEFSTLPDNLGARWQLLRHLALQWTGTAVTSGDGFPPESIDQGQSDLHIEYPTALRDWYLLFGKLPVWSARYFFLGPCDAEFRDDLLTLYDEEGETWIAGIQRSEMHLDDPPIVVEIEGKRVVSDESVSAFAMHMFLHCLPNGRAFATATVDESTIKAIEGNYQPIGLPDWSWMDGSRFVGNSDIVIEFLWHDWMSVHARKEREFREFMEFIAGQVAWNTTSDSWPPGWVTSKSDL